MATKRHAQAAGAFDVVAGEHAQAAGVDRHRFVNAELERKIGHRLRAEHAGVGAAPMRRFAHVFLQPAIRLIDAAVKHQLGRPHFQPLGRELRKQRDRIVVELPPANRIEIAEEVDHLRVPTPPQVSGQRDAFFVEIFRRKPGRHGRVAFVGMGSISIWLIRNRRFFYY